MKSKILTHTALILLALAASRLHAQGPNVLGIETGMTVDQAKGKIGPGFTYDTRQFSDPELSVVVARKPSQAWVFETVSGKIAYLYHTQRFPAGSQPNYSDTRQRLTEKYGQGGLTNGSAWAYDSAGNLMTGAIGHTCQNAANANEQATIVLTGEFARDLRVAGPSRPDCAYALTEGDGGPVNKFYLGQMTFWLKDNHTLYAETVRWNTIEKKKQQDAEQQSHGVKAPI